MSSWGELAVIRDNEAIFIWLEKVELQRVPHAAGSMNWDDVGHDDVR